MIDAQDHEEELGGLFVACFITLPPYTLPSTTPTTHDWIGAPPTEANQWMEKDNDGIWLWGQLSPSWKALSAVVTSYSAPN